MALRPLATSGARRPSDQEIVSALGTFAALKQAYSISPHIARPPVGAPGLGDKSRSKPIAPGSHFGGLLSDHPLP